MASKIIRKTKMVKVLQNLKLLMLLLLVLFLLKTNINRMQQVFSPLLPNKYFEQLFSTKTIITAIVKTYVSVFFIEF